MFTRNFDFFALLIVVTGLVMIQNLPQAGARILSTHYHTALTKERCRLGGVVTQLAKFRLE